MKNCIACAKKTVVYWQFVRHVLKNLVKNRTVLPRIGLVYTNTVEYNILNFFITVVSEFSQILWGCILSTSASFQGAAGGHIYSYVFVLGAQINDNAILQISLLQYM
jgi:hypothetical protein